jgi:hypothetical protein
MATRWWSTHSNRVCIDLLQVKEGTNAILAQMVLNSLMCLFQRPALVRKLQKHPTFLDTWDGSYIVELALERFGWRNDVLLGSVFEVCGVAFGELMAWVETVGFNRENVVKPDGSL